MGQLSQRLHDALSGPTIVIDAKNINKFIEVLDEIKTAWEKRLEELETEVEKLKKKHA